MAAPIYTGGLPYYSHGLRTKVKYNGSGAAASVTLKKGQTNEVFLFDNAAGTVYILPTPVVGLTYTFLTTVLQTSGADEIDVDSASGALMVGAVTMFSGSDVTPSSSLGPFAFTAPAASSYVEITSNGTTTGGGIGSIINCQCIATGAGAANLWMVTGMLFSPSGSLATPFSV